MESKHVILVDENDAPRGTMEKMEAHQKGELHRAYSIFIFNADKELLLQRRALDKYHSGGLWTNTCCSHPQMNENIKDSAHKRLKEEMGFDCDLEYVFQFIYKADFENELTEHELDHVFIGYCDANPKINLLEVAEWKYMSVQEILMDMKGNPDKYTTWFKIVLPKVVAHVL